MPLVKLQIAPGVVKGDTEYSSAGRWVDSDRVRFVGGMPEKLGGWSMLISTALTGIPRAAHGWRDTTGNRRLAFGTNKKVQVYYDGALYDITPSVASSTYSNNPLSTSIGTPTVTVAHTAHGRLVGDYVIIAGSAAIGGITPNGEFAVASVPDADHFTYTFTSNATSTVSGGGGASVTYVYLLANGRADDGEAAGYGRGGYGRGGYGVGAGAGLPVPARTWSLDHYGQDLIATPRKGVVYTWTPGAGAPTGRLAALTNAPTECTGAFVTDERMVFAYGVTGIASGSGATASKMTCQWCSDTDNTDWVPAETNTAGNRQLSGGNELVGHQRVAKGIYLIYSDTSAHLFQYSGDRFTFITRRVSDQAGIVGPKASGEIGGVAYWMGRDQFWMYDGTVRQMLADDIWDYVFKNINLSQKNKCFVAINTKFNEVWFFYCSSQSSEIDRYVIYSIDQRVWSIGGLGRTCWFPRDIFDTPHATDSSGHIYQHETGMDADGVAMGDYITAAPLDVDSGNQTMDVDQIVPDFQDLRGTVNISMLSRDKPSSSLTTYGPYAVTVDTEDIDPDPRIDGRQIGFTIASSGTGAAWRLGMVRVNAQPQGSRV